MLERFQNAICVILVCDWILEENTLFEDHLFCFLRRGLAFLSGRQISWKQEVNFLLSRC